MKKQPKEICKGVSLYLKETKENLTEANNGKSNLSVFIKRLQDAQKKFGDKRIVVLGEWPERIRIKDKGNYIDLNKVSGYGGDAGYDNHGQAASTGSMGI